MIDRVIGLQRVPGRIPELALLPLRLFLGLTLVYAGLQKLTDPQFFSPTAPGYIGRQMSGFVHAGSPLSPLLTGLAIEHANYFGALIAFAELWVGVSALTGMLTRLGALGGLALSLTFYLTASWSVHPYFLGPDLPYAAGWLTMMLAGPGRYTLDEYFLGPILRTVEPASAHDRKPALAPSASAPARMAPSLERSAFLRGLGTAAALVAGSSVVGIVAKMLTPNKTFASTAAPLPAATHSTAAAPGSAGAPAPAGTTFLGNVKVLPANSAGMYTDPISGDPAILIHMPDGHFVAYDAVCTHAGCTVEYDPTQHTIVCPCHGALYDPAHGAQVLAGPAPQPLATLEVKIAANGNAYARGVAHAGSASPPPAAGQGN